MGAARAREGRDRGRAAVVAGLGSALLHATLAVVLGATAPPAAPRRGEAEAGEVEFTVADPSASEPRAATATAAAPAPDVSPAPLLAAMRRPPSMPAPATESGWDFPVTAETDAGACVPPDAGAPAIRWAAIDPAAAAATVVTRDPRFARDAGVGSASAGAARSAALAEDLRGAATAQDYLTERGPPRLRRRHDGSYRYESTQFDAIIGADGSVTFSDRSIDMPAPGVFTFDLNDAVMRARGQDPYQHERQWFLDSTEPLRDRLARSAMERDADRALRALPARLARIWGDPGGTARQRRMRLFAVWDDCADDDVGRRARAIVERFVRAELPHGSADAFTNAELAALNARRASPVPFAPYG